jgi:hypothetical protein
MLLSFPGTLVDIQNDGNLMNKLLDFHAIIDGNTALHYFCQKYASPSCIILGKMLIDKGNNHI